MMHLVDANIDSVAAVLRSYGYLELDLVKLASFLIAVNACFGIISIAAAAAAAAAADDDDDASATLLLPIVSLVYARCP